MDNESSRAYRTALGFYPTAKDQAEFSIFNNCHERVVGFLRTKGIHAGNARSHHHEMAQFSFDESHALFEYARAYPQFYTLLPTIQACQSFIFTVLIATIAEQDRLHQKHKKSKQ
jgi:hypothetical protein